MTSTETAIRKILHVYRTNPLALAKVLDEFVVSEIEKRDRLTEREVAAKTCRKLHPAGCDKCICLACAKSDVFIKETLEENENV